MAALLKYNPGILGDAELIKTFVVRQRCYELILEMMVDGLSRTGASQHLLIFGPRGIGKTTLVRRIAAEVRQDPALRGGWLPIVFGEESYQITTAGEFWLEALIHLAGNRPDPNWRRTLDELREEHKDSTLRERALAQLRDIADREGKKILLVVENLDMVCDQISYESQWELRHTLANDRYFMLLGTAISRFDAISGADQAWFDLFAVQELKPLDQKECQTLWTAVANQHLRPGQARAIRILTGGNPRLLTVLASFASSRSFRELMEQLVHLIDDHTEYFKSHLDSLPVRERKVFVALLEEWKPVAAAEIALAARMTVNEVSAQLNRLVGRGAVEVVDERPRRKMYQAAERLYNIYYLMRRRGEPADRVRAAVTFMITFYAGRQLATSIADIAREACRLASEESLDHFVAYAEFAQRTPSEVFERAVDATPEEFFSRKDAPEIVRQLRLRRVSRTLSTVLSHVNKNSWTEAEDVCRAGLSRDSSDPKLWALLGYLLYLKRSLVDAENAYRRSLAIAPGERHSWHGLATVLRSQGRAAEAVDAFRGAVEADPKNVHGWCFYGNALGNLGRHERAEEAFRQATTLDPKDKTAWRGLGLALCMLDRAEEAEAPLRHAIEIDPKDHNAWSFLARALGVLGRNNEAEGAYRKATDLDPSDPSYWTDFGKFLASRGRNREAESMLRKAIKLDPTSPCPWHELGFLLSSVRSFKRAEDACRKAVELNEQHAPAWTALGVTLARSKRHQEAESAFCKAVQLSPERPFSWANLGKCLRAQKRYSEAKDAFRKAIDLGPSQSSFWSELGHLVSEMDSPREAETVWKEALELHPSLLPCSVHLLEARLEQGLPASSAVLEAEQWLERDGRTPRMLNSMARLMLRLEITDALPRVEEWAKEALEKEQRWSSVQTLGLVLAAQEKWDLAIKTIAPVVQASAKSKTARRSVTDLLIHAAAAGYGRQCLAMLKSVDAVTLEPLIVGIQLYLKESPLVPKEILEVGLDVAHQIRAFQLRESKAIRVSD